MYRETSLPNSIILYLVKYNAITSIISTTIVIIIVIVIIKTILIGTTISFTQWLHLALARYVLVYHFSCCRVILIR